MRHTAVKAVAVLWCLALVASACGGDDGDPPGASVGSPVDTVLGAQAVQDFAIHLGMWGHDADGEVVEFLGPLLEELRARSEGEIEIAGGFTFAPVEGLETRVVDAAGEVLPNISLDHGLMQGTASVSEGIEQEVLAAAEELGAPDLVAALEAGRSARPLLVEIITADYGRQRTHLGPGDRAEVDVTFLEQLHPGDDVRATHFFGQTIPGDPAEESGLDPHELFVHRWNRGLVRVLGGGGLPVAIHDDEVRVVEGSTILSRDAKRTIEGLVYVAEYSLAPRIDQSRDLFSGATIDMEIGDAEVSIGWDESVVGDCSVDSSAPECTGVNPSTGGRGTYDGYYDRGPSWFIEVDGEVTHLGPSWWMVREAIRVMRATAACVAAAAELRARNEAGRDPRPNVLDRYPSLRGEVGPLERDAEPDDPPPLGCNEPPENDGPPDGGGIHGDVRVTTIDGITYGQQATGEFLVFENDTTLIQMRAEPAGTSDRLTIATAFAMGTGGESISMHAGGHTYVDGEPRVLERGERIRVGDAEVLWGFFDGWTIVWPDGQLVKVFDRGDANGMTLTVQPGPSRAVGQLGDGDGDRDNDFVTRDGQALAPSIVDDFDAFYGTYVDSWRLSQEESLLHYEAGETTESFLIEGFPSAAVSMDELDPDARADAESACAAAAVLDDALYEGCVIDVASTGDPGYAYDAFRVQLVKARSEEPAAVDVPAETPGVTALTIGGDRMVFGGNPPDQRDGGVAPSWDCQITDGNLFADGSIDLADGPRYAISVQYLGAEPRFTLTVQRTLDDQTADYAWVLTNVAHFADAVQGVTLDGTRLTASGELYVNDPPELGLAPFSQLPAGATLDPFTLDLDCVG